MDSLLGRTVCDAEFLADLVARLTFGRLCYNAAMHYQTLRSVSDNHVFLICGADEAFADLPDHVRHQGPWQAMQHGEIEKLKANYRLAPARHGYALVKCELAVFKPEA